MSLLVRLPFADRGVCMIEASTIDACSTGTQAAQGWLNRLHMQRFEC